MQNDTRVKFMAFASRVALLNGIANAAEQFTVAPTIQQKLESKLLESSAFMKRINVVPVRDKEGAKLGLGNLGPIAGRTNTATGNPRKTRATHSLDKRGFKCATTHFDTHIRWATLDSWSEFPDFETRVRDQCMQQQGLDRLIIGWNGTHVAENTDIVANPLLQDVNVGWLQILREEAPHQVIPGINTAAEGAPPLYRPIRVGPNGDFANMDALVMSAIMLMEPQYREDTGLEAICGRELLHDKYFPVVNQDNKPSETLAAQTVVAQKRMGNLPANTQPFFPPRSTLITRPDNLSIYWQAGARRRQLKDHAELEQIENFESSNDAYAIERIGAAVLVENIEFGEWPAPAAGTGD